MIRAELRGLLGRKLRTILTAVAIILGVAMVSGTFVLTDSIDKAFNSIFTDCAERLGRGDHRQGRDEHEQRLDRADGLGVAAREGRRRCPDVAAAEGNVGGDAHLIGSNGKAIVFGGAPNLGFSIAARRVALQPADARRRAAGRTGSEVVIDRGTAKKKHFSVGDDDRRPGAGPGRPDEDLGARQVRHGRHRRRDARRLRPARRRRRSSTSAARSTRSTSRRSRASPIRSCSARCGRSCRPTRRCGPARSRRHRTRRTRTPSSRSCAASCSRSAASRSSSAAS